tara:strand:+ start:5596 stop:7533 length:1938 start_codon:yes stop_codon:yes gene_type:complete
MCGIVGFVDKNKLSDSWKTDMTHMLKAIEKRGPDANDVWFSTEDNLCLGHTRLSIIDTSNAGSQPMLSNCQRWVISFNGEIYNFLDLREELNKSHNIDWRGTSDTEVFLNFIKFYGLDTALKKSSGMFSFALYDKKEKKLYLSRDRVGEKPLFYGWIGNTFWFGSSLNSLTKLTGFNKEINPNAIEYLLKHNYIKAPHSIYKNINKLIPGTYLSLSLINFEHYSKTYWSYEDESEDKNNFSSQEEYVDELDSRLTKAVQRSMISDVPLGAFLSGGIDSSTIVSLMQKSSSKPIKTFTIGFKEASFNEAEYAKKIANHLGTDHTELYLTSQDALNVIPSLPKFYDEPFADSSQIPTYLVSKLAREHVTVSLSGDAGDELFCGYTRYEFAKKYISRLNNIPNFIRKSSSKFIEFFSEEQWNNLYKILPRKLLPTNIGNKMHKVSKLLKNSESSLDELSYGLLTHINSTDNLLSLDYKPDTFSEYINLISTDKRDHLERMMHLDILTYLPDDILTKVDRASMAVSLESRVPFLDKDVLELSKIMPLNIKYKDNKLKWPLRKILEKYVPKEYFERPKMGFGIPIDIWLREDLKEWCQDLISSDALQKDNYLNADEVDRLYNEHLAGNPRSSILWNIFSYLTWKIDKNLS